MKVKIEGIRVGGYEGEFQFGSEGGMEVVLYWYVGGPS